MVTPELPETSLVGEHGDVWKGMQSCEVVATHSLTSVSETLLSGQMLDAYFMRETGQSLGSNRTAVYMLLGGISSTFHGKASLETGPLNPF